MGVFYQIYLKELGGGHTRFSGAVCTYAPAHACAYAHAPHAPHSARIFNRFEQTRIQLLKVPVKLFAADSEHCVNSFLHVVSPKVFISDNFWRTWFIFLQVLLSAYSNGEHCIFLYLVLNTLGFVDSDVF